MIDETGTLTLRELVLEYPIILMDSSVLYGRLSEKGSQSESYIPQRLEFLGLLENFLHEGLPFFTTNLVSQEYISGGYPYKEIIKKRVTQNDRSALDSARKIMNMKKRERKLMDLLSEKGRVIELTEEEKKKYNSIKNTYQGQSSYELGEVDADLLISGAVLSETRGATCLASNDFGIFNIWKRLLKSRRTTREQYGFAVRLNLNSFKLLDNNHIQRD